MIEVLNTSATGNLMEQHEFALMISSEDSSAGEKSSSFSLLKPPYSTGRFSGAINLFLVLKEINQIHSSKKKRKKKIIKFRTNM